MDPPSVEAVYLRITGSGRQTLCVRVAYGLTLRLGGSHLVGLCRNGALGPIQQGFSYMIMLKVLYKYPVFKGIHAPCLGIIFTTTLRVELE